MHVANDPWPQVRLPAQRLAPREVQAEASDAKHEAVHERVEGALMREGREGKLARLGDLLIKHDPVITNLQ